jgi:hypothetical protein
MPRELVPSNDKSRELFAKNLQIMLFNGEIIWEKGGALLKESPSGREYLTPATISSFSQSRNILFGFAV